MSVTITFAGACLFVPRSDTNTMHVLMPITKPGMRHVPVMIVDTAYLRPGSTRLDKADAYIDLRDHSWTLSGTGATLSICQQVLNLADVTAARPSDTQIGKDDDAAMGATVAARISLAGGAMEAVARGACWNWRGAPRRIAHMARWKYDTVDYPVRAKWGGLHGKAATHTVELYPIGGNIEIEIFHVIPSDLPISDIEPVEPSPNQEAPHFHLFYDLLHDMQEIPTYRADQDACRPKGGDCTEFDYEGTSPYTCVVAAVGP